MPKVYYKKGSVSTFTILRDFFINILPIKKLSPFLLKLLFPFNPNFIFLVHPRNMDDVYHTIPFLKIISKIIPEKTICKIISICPVYSVAKIKWKNKINGLIVTTTYLPSMLFEKRENAVRMAEKIISYIRKTTLSHVCLGLGGWWPIITNNGLAFNKFLDKNDRIKVTNGHTGTLASIYLTIKKISLLSGRDIHKLSIMVLGVGRMGEAVAKVLNGNVHTIALGDKNTVRLDIVKNMLEKETLSSVIKIHFIPENINDNELNLILSKYDIVICTTSNVSYITDNEKALKGCIIIDDARPEAFPRILDFDTRTAVLEGGLMKIEGIEVNYDFGFGKKDNVFGCLAETFMLALDKTNKLKPTLGEINFDNFETLLKFCEENNITVGDFISGYTKLTNLEIQKFLNKARS